MEKAISANVETAHPRALLRGNRSYLSLFQLHTPRVVVNRRGSGTPHSSASAHEALSCIICPLFNSALSIVFFPLRLLLAFKIFTRRHIPPSTATESGFPARKIRPSPPMICLLFLCSRSRWNNGSNNRLFSWLYRCLLL